MNIKVVISLILCMSLLCFLFALPQTEGRENNLNSDFLRIHIRANSNSEVDQNVKYKVKDAVVEYLTPLLCDVYDKSSALKIVLKNLNGIEEVSNKVLGLEGFSYKSNAEITFEKFPTRVYDNLTLEEGFYDSLIVNLGTGNGNNWWCVLYPPLCFVNGNSSNNITYRSKLLEIINSFWRK